MRQRALLAAPSAIPFATFIRFMSGPWSEEFGWRGYALDPLIARFGRLPGSVLLGLIWGVWHLPLFLMPATGHGQSGLGLTGFWTFLAYNVGMALLMTWVYLRINRSILSAMLLHFVGNYALQLIEPYSERVAVCLALLLLLGGLAACLPLSRRQSQQHTPAEAVQW